MASGHLIQRREALWLIAYLQINMANEILAIWIFLYWTIPIVQGSDMKVTCVKPHDTFSVMGHQVKCLNEKGHSNCEKVGLFESKEQCYQCCNNTATTAEPLPAITTAKAQTVKQVPTTKTAQNKEKVLTTLMTPTKEDVKKTKSSNDLVEIGLPVLIAVCGAFTVGAIVFMVKMIIKRRRYLHANSRPPPHPQPEEKLLNPVQESQTANALLS